jgi:hypothetical protein
MRLRDYLPSDFEAVKAIHDKTQIDYSFPNINASLWLVTKVVEDDSGTVRACGGAYIQAEVYLWMDSGDWADSADKLTCISALDGAVLHDVYLRGVDEAVLYLPPGMERFGERLAEMGWKPNRDGWVCYHKRLNA